jgi:hypothetical protein
MVATNREKRVQDSTKFSSQHHLGAMLQEFLAIKTDRDVFTTHTPRANNLIGDCK